MKILCISASNTASKVHDSTSVNVCKTIEKIIHDKKEDVIVEIVSLAEYNLKFCRLCGDCSKDSICPYDDSFNQLYLKILKADLFFFVVPHYSPIPSKLLCVFEKINEIVYAGYIANNKFKVSFAGKPVGIIGHGGMSQSDKSLKYYHDNLITPIANTLRSLSFQVVGLDEYFSNGTAFGLDDDNCIVEAPNSVFPNVLQNFNSIENTIRPFVDKVVLR